jgi:hypothetical protein
MSVSVEGDLTEDPIEGGKGIKEQNELSEHPIP